jgi:ADP-ribose pyrophosphatase YjhB (NUDIX family)
MTTFARARIRLMHLYFRLARPMTLGVRGVVVDAEERVLLVRHTYLPGWHLPGGGIEAGEAAPESLAREVWEEGAVRVTGPAVLHGFFHNRNASPRDHVAVYVVREFDVAGPKTPDREIAEAGFFPRAALPAQTTRATRARLAEIFEGAPVDPHW